MPSLTERKPVALITDANRGIGLEVSRQLGKLGYHVLLGCRSEARGVEAEQLLRAEGLDANCILLDVACAHSISAARQRIEALTDRVDVVINNAAIHYDSWERVTNVDWDVVTEAFEVNAFGAWRVTLEFLPLLKRSPEPQSSMFRARLARSVRCRAALRPIACRRSHSMP